MKTKNNFWLVLLACLAACAPAQPSVSAIQTEAMVMAQVSIALTQTALPTATLPPPTVMPTATATLILYTPTPMQPPFLPIMTPDAYQVEHWKEYQDALAKRFIFSDYVPYALCEWDILGRANQEVYVWAVCAAPSYQSTEFAVIHLAANATIQSVDYPYHGDWENNVRKMFPSDVQERMTSYDAYGIAQEMLNHIDWRRTHPDEPPLIMLSASSTATPTP